MDVRHDQAAAEAPGDREEAERLMLRKILAAFLDSEDGRGARGARG